MMRSVLTVACALVLVLSGVTAGAADVAGGTGAADTESLRLTQQDFDRTQFTIVQYANGSARWTFTFTRTLANESEKRAFRSYAEEFNDNETELYRGFVADAEALTTEGRNVTGRDMTATSFTRSAEVDEGFSSTDEARGVVRMSFLWTEFAATDGDQVMIADVFEGGLYIGPSQSLVVQPGPELAFRSVDPAPTSQEDPESIVASDSVTWQGEQSFADQRPRIVFGPSEGTPSGGTDGGVTETATSSPTPGTGDGGGILPWLALALVLLLALVGGYAYRTGAFGGDAAAATTDDGVSGAGAASTDAAGAADGAASDISDEELMSDEDRVVAMLEERGGRMKQVNIVEETGWSKSKVSMLLSDMEEEGTLSKLRVGRENIVSLSGHEPEAAGSPFDDEE